MSDYKVLIGQIGVDSGQVMIVDPCYLKEWKDNEFSYKTGLRNKQTGKLVCCWDEVEGLGKINWSTPLPEYGGKCMNDLADDKENWEQYENYPDEGKFDYSGVCGTTCKGMFGEIGGGLAVASRTYMGDGCYPVYAITEGQGGRVKQIIIDFYGNEDLEDENFGDDDEQ